MPIVKTVDGETIRIDKVAYWNGIAFFYRADVKFVERSVGFLWWKKKKLFAVDELVVVKSMLMWEVASVDYENN